MVFNLAHCSRRCWSSLTPPPPVHRTKNGERVAVQKLDDDEGPLFPTVALDTPGVIWINLGDAPFAHPPNDDDDKKDKKKKKSKKAGKDKKTPRGGKKTPRDGKKTPRGGKDKSASNDNEAEAEEQPKAENEGDKGKEKAEAEQQPAPVAPPAPAQLTGWHLVDAYTLVYRPACAWPNATKFTVQIPASVLSFYNEPIEPFKKEYKSRTASVEHTSVDSGEAQVLDPTIAICFDQKIDPTEVIKHVQVRTRSFVGMVIELLIKDDTTNRCRRRSGASRMWALWPWWPTTRCRICVPPSCGTRCSSTPSRTSASSSGAPSRSRPRPRSPSRSPRSPRSRDLSWEPNTPSPSAPYSRSRSRVRSPLRVCCAVRRIMSVRMPHIQYLAYQCTSHARWALSSLSSSTSTSHSSSPCRPRSKTWYELKSFRIQTVV